MIERYRESWITDWLQATLGDWTGLILLSIGIALCAGYYVFIHLPLITKVASKEPDHDRRQDHHRRNRKSQ